MEIRATITLFYKQKCAINTLNYMEKSVNITPFYNENLLTAWLQKRRLPLQDVMG